MLVLSRQRDETIMIGDHVEITVVDIRGDKVRLGITAPPQVAVHRKEVYEAIKAENRRAAEAPDDDFRSLSAPVRPGRRAGVPSAGRVSASRGGAVSPPSEQPTTRPARARTPSADADGPRQAAG